MQTVTFRALYVLIVVSHDRRRNEHWNVTRHPRAAWIWQQILEATAWGRRPRFLIRDPDRCFGTDFVMRAEGMGIATILTPVREPNANAIAERVIGTLRRECLDHLIVISERHLRRVFGEYIQHYNAMRPHCSLGLDAPQRRSRTERFPCAQLRRHAVLGGLHHEYWWAARVFASPRPSSLFGTAPVAGTSRCSVRCKQRYRPTRVSRNRGFQCAPSL